MDPHQKLRRGISRLKNAVRQTRVKAGAHGVTNFAGERNVTVAHSDGAGSHHHVSSHQVHQIRQVNGDTVEETRSFRTEPDDNRAAQ